MNLNVYKILLTDDIIYIRKNNVLIIFNKFYYNYSFRFCAWFS